MKPDFIKVVNEIRNKYGHSIKIEYHDSSTWARLTIYDRTFLLKEKNNIEKIFEECGFFRKYELETNWWQWEDYQYGRYYFRNPSQCYQYFLCSLSDVKNTLKISNTTDPIYNVCLFQLRDVINNSHKDNKNFKSCPIFNRYGRLENYYAISFWTLTEAQKFDSINLFERKLSWYIEETNTQKQYVCHMYYNDKEDLCQNITLKSLIKRTTLKIKSPKSFSKKDLFEKVKSGEITYEEFEKILQKDETKL